MVAGARPPPAGVRTPAATAKGRVPQPRHSRAGGNPEGAWPGSWFALAFEDVFSVIAKELSTGLELPWESNRMAVIDPYRLYEEIIITL